MSKIVGLTKAVTSLLCSPWALQILLKILLQSQSHQISAVSRAYEIFLRRYRQHKPSSLETWTSEHCAPQLEFIFCFSCWLRLNWCFRLSSCIFVGLYEINDILCCPASWILSHLATSRREVQSWVALNIIFTWDIIYSSIL